MSDYLPALPEEVVAEMILWRLPVKSIMQCRCVCKSWYSLIASPNFISTHLLKTLTKNPQILLNPIDYSGSCLLLFDNQHYLQSMLLHLHLTLPSPCCIEIVGSVKGLMCFSISGVNVVINFILCNPSIRRFLSIPPPLSGIRGNVMGFGFDETSQDYKILLIISGSTGGFIYSLSSNCWRVITSPVPKSLKLEFSSAVFVNGRFHWLAYGANSVSWIMVFDLKDETFGQISLPECLADSQVNVLGIKEFGQSSIAIIHQTFIDEFKHCHVWVMKEYGSVESWMKLATIGSSEFLLGFRNEDEVVIRRETCVVSRKINNNKSDQVEEVKKMVDVDKHPSLMVFSVHKYVPSLVLLDKQNNVDVTVDVTLTPLEETAEIVAEEE